MIMCIVYGLARATSIHLPKVNGTGATPCVCPKSTHEHRIDRINQDLRSLNQAGNASRRNAQLQPRPAASPPAADARPIETAHRSGNLPDRQAVMTR